MGESWSKSRRDYGGGSRVRRLKLKLLRWRKVDGIWSSGGAKGRHAMSQLPNMVRRFAGLLYVPNDLHWGSFLKMSNTTSTTSNQTLRFSDCTSFAVLRIVSCQAPVRYRFQSLPDAPQLIFSRSMLTTKSRGCA